MCSMSGVTWKSEKNLPIPQKQMKTKIISIFFWSYGMIVREKNALNRMFFSWNRSLVLIYRVVFSHLLSILDTKKNDWKIHGKAGAKNRKWWNEKQYFAYSCWIGSVMMCALFSIYFILWCYGQWLHYNFTTSNERMWSVYLVPAEKTHIYSILEREEKKH